MKPETETYRNSQTQCHCNNPRCVAADPMRHPCGRCVREGMAMVRGTWLCEECEGFDDRIDGPDDPTRWGIERLTGLAKRAGLLILVAAALQGCAHAPCGARWEQTDEAAAQWEAEAEARAWWYERARLADSLGGNWDAADSVQAVRQ